MNHNNKNTSSLYENYGLCVRFPPKVHSVGLWDAKDPFTYALPALEVQMVTIFFLTQLLHYPLRRFGIPRIFSEIMVGIILGPTLPQSFKNFTKRLFPIDTQGIISTVSVFGYMFFMFLIGVKTDLSVLKPIGREALIIGISSLILPLMIGIAIVQVFIGELTGEKEGLEKVLYPAIFIQSVSPFPVIALFLKDLKIINSELGRLVVSSAVCSEMLNISMVCIIKMFKSFMDLRQSAAGIIQNVGLTIGLVLIIVVIVRPTALWMIRQTPEGRPVRDSYIYSIILVVLLAGSFTQWIGHTPILGAILTGFAIPDGPPLASALSDKLDSFVSGLFLPIFITLIALRVNLLSINLRSPFAVSTIIMVLATFSAKVFACMIPAWICRVPFKDALALGFIMSSKGIVQMSLYSMFRDEQIFNEEIFALLVISTAVLAIVVPILVKQTYVPSKRYTGYQKRSIVDSENDEELRMVMCIHRPGNIPAFINLLDVSCPSRESTIAVFVLHLIELEGRAAPLLITHHLQQKNDNTYSQDVIFAFRKHVRQYHGTIWAQAFTAISPRKLMHEDICNLALKKVAALIVIPFHRKWAIDGSIEMEDFSLRSLNCKIFDAAPCSVGILIDRGRNQVQQASTTQLSSQRVAVIFFGGRDDREALAFAIRMVGKLSTHLTVARFTTTVGGAYSDKEEILDSDALDDIKRIGRDSVPYVEQAVKDGPETALIVHDMVDEFDLIIVGRHKNVSFPQISGLEEWSEFPELGVIGDFLSSSDHKGRASVLVVQQHRHKIR
ncbi:unnamed protein product [Camellia sinensis]